ncbi:helix-hairpin-helix domain-containing protein [Paracoccus onubensis]|uniref:helix-hairpin-helix domain-containing protein n=1 Tax=Paracoccus onubensis TaxID=1675788 RepID=UPI001601850D|nr:helix-hairpin-helix domain-containing protein [Paracoccus onubensis]
MQSAIGLLRDLTETQSYRVARRNSAHVQGTWGPILRDFENITPGQYRRFLDFDENQHWTTLYRQVTPTLENNNFRNALAALAAEDVDVADRIDNATQVPGVGIGTASALLCTMDGRWGVWNGTTEAALKKLGRWPTFPRGLTVGGRYLVVNDILFDLAGQLDVTQWEFDHLMWLVLQDDPNMVLEPIQKARPGTFNALIEERSGYDLANCRFVRHSQKSVGFWTKSRANLEHYFGYQREGSANPYNNAEIVFQFIPNENATEALFVGAYRVLDQWTFPDDQRQHIMYLPEFGENDDRSHARFDLERLPEFEELVGRVVVDWGTGTRAWSQWCNRNQKRIVNHVTRDDELSKAYEKIAAGVKYRTKDDTDRQIQVQQTVKAVALAEGCDIETLIKRLAGEQGHRCKITNIPFEPTGWNAPSPDRIDSDDREYADDKVQIVCKWVNFAKGNKPDDVFRDLMHQAAECMTRAV